MMSKRGRLLTGLILVALMLMTIGCRKAGDGQAAGPVVPDAPAKAPAPMFPALFNPTNITELMGVLSGLTYTSAFLDAGDEVDQMEIEYQFLGEDTVGGQKVSKVSVRIADGVNPEEMNTIWVDAGGEAVKFETDGAARELWIAGYVFEGSLFLPWVTADLFDVRKALADGRPGYGVEVVDTQQVNFGSVAAKVTTVKVSDEDTGLSVGLWSVADFGSFQMIVATDVDRDDADSGFVFRVTAVVTR
ncbi:MAG: hypothetical protein RDU89_02820 [bacterium]|nr:hypothetical protein [bacterium]